MQCMLADPRDDYVVSSLYCEHPSENTEAKKQASVTMCEFSFCVEAIMFTKLSRLLLYGQKKNWVVKEKESALLISTLTALEHLFVAVRYCSTVAI